MDFNLWRKRKEICSLSWRGSENSGRILSFRVWPSFQILGCCLLPLQLWLGYWAALLYGFFLSLITWWETAVLWYKFCSIAFMALYENGINECLSHKECFLLSVMEVKTSHTWYILGRFSWDDWGPLLYIWYIWDNYSRPLPMIITVSLLLCFSVMIASTRVLWAKDRFLPVSFCQLVWCGLVVIITLDWFPKSSSTLLIFLAPLMRDFRQVPKLTREHRGACACRLDCFICVWLFATLWTIAWQASLSIGFSR